MSERAHEVLTEFGAGVGLVVSMLTAETMAREIAAMRQRVRELEQERGEADEALAACQAQASGEIATLRAQLTAMTEARDLWQSEARIQQAHRERAERERDALRVTNAEDMPIAVRNISEIITENHTLRHRAERAERVVAQARVQREMRLKSLDCGCESFFCEHRGNYRRACLMTENAVEALDAHHASEGDG